MCLSLVIPSSDVATETASSVDVIRDEAVAAEDALIKNSICSFPDMQRREGGSAHVGGLELISDDLMLVRDESPQKREVKESTHSYGFTETGELWQCNYVREEMTEVW